MHLFLTYLVGANRASRARLKAYFFLDCLSFVIKGFQGFEV